MTLPEADLLPPIEELITQEKIDRYAELSGDFNPLHVDPEFAASSEFGGTIAHGPMQLQACFRSVCAWLGTEAFPPGSRLAVVYRHPARPGDRVRFELDPQSAAGDGGTVEGKCRNQDGTMLALVTMTLPPVSPQTRVEL